jgi:flagellar hook-basal body complex protein FliE
LYIRPISMPNLAPVASKTIQSQSPVGAEDAFSGALQKASSTLEKLDQEALKAQMDLVTGNARDMHTAVLSVEKASLALDLVVSVRNKALEAYQEIMRMPV